MSEFEIRAARSGDLTAIVELLEGAHLPAEDLTEEKLGAFIVAIGNEGCLGVAGLEVFAGDALLRSLAVGAKQRGQGLGRRLLQAIETDAARRGVTSLFLLTTTATPFFEQAGYNSYDRGEVPSTIASTREFSDICPGYADCLWRVLPR